VAGAAFFAGVLTRGATVPTVMVVGDSVTAVVVVAIVATVVAALVAT
jgi:hypothetical protein